MADSKIKLKLVKSTAGCDADHRATVRGLGLRKIRQSTERPDTPTVRGLIHQVRHLVEVEEA